ncbi:MAG: hypothetical protein DMF63_03790 [Acidobacteria bacterium]|nr:MAG: hypothetical protein DMF63_03790 [Acidobacteriota bacterium]
MNRLLIFTLCLFICSHNLIAQTSDTFDIATFTPPSGWKKQTKEEAVLFSIADDKKGTFALLTIYASGESSGDAKHDFESDWQEFIAGQLGVTSKPALEPVEKRDGWDVVTGGASFENKTGPSAVILRTFSGFGKRFSAAAIFNSQDSLPAIEAFASSINLKKSETKQSQAGSQPSITQFFWKQSQSRKDIGGYAGYSKNTYQFNADGTYQFSRVDFQNYSPKYYLENEEGTYKIAGNKMTITPKKSIFSSHKSRKDDAPLRSGNLELAVLQYSFEFMDLHNDGRWSLLLSPVNGVETKRDGVFSFQLNGEKRKTYSYSAVNANGELVP